MQMLSELFPFFLGLCFVALVYLVIKDLLGKKEIPNQEPFKIRRKMKLMISNSNEWFKLNEHMKEYLQEKESLMISLDSEERYQIKSEEMKMEKHFNEETLEEYQVKVGKLWVRYINIYDNGKINFSLENDKCWSGLNEKDMKLVVANIPLAKVFKVTTHTTVTTEEQT
ncbi:hypothetical protein LHV56_19115 [Peribacillus frigoritolerans]|uniref:hypothetical protein n=1 Tax=Peribacillus frigoritolerans TaxID=450367 RepID=UPI002079E000|nr:hypothetical protein [Peribacillus frigoritolerans]USK78944.1 hypothetical protein LHV56_19115 [Peribacillus frigoritolerans]